VRLRLLAPLRVDRLGDLPKRDPDDEHGLGGDEVLLVAREFGADADDCVSSVAGMSGSVASTLASTQEEAPAQHRLMSDLGTRLAEIEDRRAKRVERAHNCPP
jgi:hypothetical protein